ncbi:hypothetical protein GCM10027578_15840 [Spirosoma luteolum]
MKHLIAAGCCLLALTAHAQDDRLFKPVKVNTAIGYATPLTPGAIAGVGLSLEPKYAFSDQIDLGLRLELALTAGAVTNNGQTSSVSVKGLTSYLLTGNYLFTTNRFRAFAGGGVGLFNVAGGTVPFGSSQNRTDFTVVGGTKFGGMLRTGFAYGHLTLAAEYNLIPSSTAIFSTTSLRSTNRYLAIKLGFDIGGGRYE